MARTAIPRTLDIALVLELDELPIAGTMQLRSNERQRFDGWLELIAAIETSLRAAREDLAPSQPRKD